MSQAEPTIKAVGLRIRTYRLYQSITAVKYMKP